MGFEGQRRLPANDEIMMEGIGVEVFKACYLAIVFETVIVLEITSIDYIGKVFRQFPLKADIERVDRSIKRIRVHHFIDLDEAKESAGLGSVRNFIRGAEVKGFKTTAK